MDRSCHLKLIVKIVNWPGTRNISFKVTSRCQYKEFSFCVSESWTTQECANQSRFIFACFKSCLKIKKPPNLAQEIETFTENILTQILMFILYIL